MTAAEGVEGRFSVCVVREDRKVTASELSAGNVEGSEAAALLALDASSPPLLLADLADELEPVPAHVLHPCDLIESLRVFEANLINPQRALQVEPLACHGPLEESSFHRTQRASRGRGLR
eukprot:754984-Hanusia_phi.AAC.7